MARLNVLVLISATVLVLAANAIRYPTKYCNPGTKLPMEKKEHGASLQLVQVLTRHGDRSPVHGCKWTGNQHFKCDSSSYLGFGTTELEQPLYKKQYISGCERGQLTGRGFQQHVTNGKEVRRYYTEVLGFLPEKWEIPDSVYLRSTDYMRTILSAEAFINGVFGTETSFRRTVLTMNKERDVLYPNPRRCPLLQHNYEAFEESALNKDHHEKVTKPLRVDIAKALGIEEEEVQGMEVYADCAYCYLCHNMDIPTAIDQHLFDRISEEFLWRYRTRGGYPSPIENGRLGIGEILKIWIDNVNTKIADANSPLQLSVMAAHDTTLLPLLEAFQVLEEWPGYAATVILELWETEGTHAIRLRVNGESVLIPGCDKELCSFNLFMDKVAKQFLPIEGECFRSPQSKNKPEL